MKYIILILVFWGLLAPVSAQNMQNVEWRTYLEGIRIDDIADAGDYLWLISDFNTRIIKFEKKTGNIDFFDYKDFNIQPDDWIIIIECDNNGLPWVGTFAGAYKMADNNEWVLIHPKGTYAITKSKDGVVWIAYQHELIRYEGDLIKVIDEREYEGGSFSSLATDSKGDLWSLRLNIAGFLENFSKYDGNNWNNFAPPFILVSVSNLTIDENGTKWMSTYLGPLISYDDTVWKTYDTPVQTRTNSIAIENENVWCGTRDGLMQFNNSQWTIYNTENSELPSDIVYQIAVDSDGTKWIATENGLASLKLGITAVEAQFEEKQFSLYPNPAHDYINLKVPKELQSSTVDIITINGQVIQSFKQNENQTQLDVSQVPAGVYMVRIQSNENQIIKKFVKQ